VHILHIVGARPNFMKAAPVLAALKRRGIRQSLVHTGQHYDANMSEVFFGQLCMPAPDVNLEVGSGTHAQQTASIMSRLEPVLLELRPDLTMVYGDVNSTIAAALVCTKLVIPIAHVEAGLRSFDRTMPEEINRLLTDQLGELLFTPSVDANSNLKREGVDSARIHFVGNVMIDTLVRLLPLAKMPRLLETPESYALVTIHRPSNVDNPDTLAQIVRSLEKIGERIPVLFPVHPRTRARIAKAGVTIGDSSRLQLLGPLGYLEFLALQRSATVVITDSGGIQEETTFLGVPCLTLRENTERPVTVTIGTNLLVGGNPHQLVEHVARISEGSRKRGMIPPLWDGAASERIADVISN